MSRAADALAMTPEQILDVGHRAGSEHRHLHVMRKSGPTPGRICRGGRGWPRSGRRG